MITRNQFPCEVHLYCDDGGSEAQDDEDSRHHLQVLQQLRAHDLLELSANLREVFRICEQNPSVLQFTVYSQGR